MTMELTLSVVACQTAIIVVNGTAPPFSNFELDIVNGTSLEWPYSFFLDGPGYFNWTVIAPPGSTLEFTAYGAGGPHGGICTNTLEDRRVDPRTHSRESSISKVTSVSVSLKPTSVEAATTPAFSLVPTTTRRTLQEGFTSQRGNKESAYTSSVLPVYKYPSWMSCSTSWRTLERESVEGGVVATGGVRGVKSSDRRTLTQELGAGATIEGRASGSHMFFSSSRFITEERHTSSWLKTATHSTHE
ncbi:hypothetical protein BT69DRAFT_1326637 [Atractiella rhizophila]|nr:hypothetical protein BT69DRAFT_1326637 [Atractiella rhizophila]